MDEDSGINDSKIRNIVDVDVVMKNKENINKNDDDNVKRLKTEDFDLGKSEESSCTSSNNTETIDNLPSTSVDLATSASSNSKFKSVRNSKTRNYRNNNHGDHNEEQLERIDNVDENMDEIAEEPTVDTSTAESPDIKWDDDEDDNDNGGDGDGDEMEEDGGDEDDEDDDDGEESNSEDEHRFVHNFSSDDSLSTSTVMHDTDNETDLNEHPLLKKDKPKHTWFVIDAISKRQYGSSAKLQSRDLFQRRCYGSLYAVRKLELMHKLEEHNGCVNSLNFHPDGTLLASGADDLKVCIWDWSIGKCIMKYKTHHRSNVFQSKFLHLSGDLYIASCARDGQVRLAQLSREGGVRNNRALGSHHGPCHKLIVLPEQPQIILSAGEDGVVLNHDARGPKSTKVVTVEEEEGIKVALYSIHGHPLKTNEFLVSGRESIVRVYDQRKANQPAATYTPFKKTKNKYSRSYHVTCAVYNYDGTEILASYSDADIYLFDVNNPEPGKFLHQYQGHKNQATIKGVNYFGPKSEFIVSGSDCGHIYFWEKKTESLAQWLLADDNGVVNCLEPHPQLPFICTSGLDWDIKVWVPSNEIDPSMEGLSKTLRNNAKNKSNNDPVDINESEMLWMLWRHLRNSNRFRADPMVFPGGHFHDSNSSSDSLSSGDTDEEFDGTQNCSTS